MNSLPDLPAGCQILRTAAFLEEDPVLHHRIALFLCVGFDSVFEVKRLIPAEEMPRTFTLHSL